MRTRLTPQYTRRADLPPRCRTLTPSFTVTATDVHPACPCIQRMGRSMQNCTFEIDFQSATRCASSGRMHTDPSRSGLVKTLRRSMISKSSVSASSLKFAWVHNPDLLTSPARTPLETCTWALSLPASLLLSLSLFYLLQPLFSVSTVLSYQREPRKNGRKAIETRGSYRARACQEGLRTQ